MSLQQRIQNAIQENKLSGRVWLYSNYHCNLACRYCLTESSPSVAKRILTQDLMVNYAKQAVDLGFTGIGITGGEPFLLPHIIETIREISDILPVTILTNGTLFNERRLEQIDELANRDIRMQISLDSPDPIINDAMRGPQNYAKVIDAIPKLIARGIRVRIATTVDTISAEQEQRLRTLVKSLGVPENDHVIRKIVKRGRAVQEEMGVRAPLEKLPPELTITTDGAFWSPFAPTYVNQKLQKDFLISKVTTPLQKPAQILLNFIANVKKSADDEDITGFV